MQSKFKIGDAVWWNGRGHNVLGFAARTDDNGVPFVELAWNDYTLSPTGYLAVPEKELKDAKFRGTSEYFNALDTIDKLKKEFPGLVDGETEVNGGDLVEFLTVALAGDTPKN